MKTVIIASTIAGFAGLASASPYLSASAADLANASASNSQPQGSLEVLSVDISNVSTNAAFGSALNEVYTYNLAPNAQVVGVSWDLDIETIGASYLSEARFDFTDSAITTGVSLTAAVGEDAPGAGNFSSGGFLSLVDAELDFAVGADGVLRIEFWEGFVDNAGAGDAILNGNISFQYVVPAPGAFAVLGLGGLVATRRRR